MARDSNGERARKVTTRVIGAYFKAKIEVRSMPEYAGTTKHHLSKSRIEPTCRDCQQKSIAITQNAICVATRTHSSGMAVIASLLNTIMPIEHAIQEPTPTTVSEYDMAAATSQLIRFAFK
mmetsp:Transcript_111726/g.222097  ORF Transcript_111726/g.222097 Transcript_111726/m.222097 type:complete len:121 (+) Transcript_111726:685-1047(+)